LCGSLLVNIFCPGSSDAYLSVRDPLLHILYNYIQHPLLHMVHCCVYYTTVSRILHSCVTTIYRICSVYPGSSHTWFPVAYITLQ
jgi:hypothetical protein